MFNGQSTCKEVANLVFAKKVNFFCNFVCNFRELEIYFYLSVFCSSSFLNNFCCPFFHLISSHYTHFATALFLVFTLGRSCLIYGDSLCFRVFAVRIR